VLESIPLHHIYTEDSRSILVHSSLDRVAVVQNTSRALPFAL